MTEVRERRATEWAPGAEHARAEGRGRRYGEAGWSVFAGSILLLAGAFEFILGLMARLRNGFFLVGSNSLLAHVNFDIWGYTHMALGAALGGTGLLAMLRRPIARPLGVLLALGAAVVNLGFFPASPFWVFVTIALDVIAIATLTARWSDPDAWVGIRRIVRGVRERTSGGPSHDGPARHEEINPERTSGPRR